MIRTLSVDGKKLELRDEPDDNSNIFDVDSISLLIGENGTGKTYFLNQVINEFKSSHIGAFTGGVKLISSTFRATMLKTKLDIGGLFISPQSLSGKDMHRQNVLLMRPPTMEEALE